MIAVGLLTLIAISGVFSASGQFNILSDEYIDYINSLQITWKAGRNFPKDVSLSYLERRLGVVEQIENKISQTVHHVKDDDVDIPDTFDAREQWPNCDSIRLIRDQPDCKSSWAVAAAAAMSDRICIASNGTDQTLVSDEDLLSCCEKCGYGCSGGFPDEAWIYWASNGIVTGGPYNSTTGCKASSMAPCDPNGATDSLPQCPTGGYSTPECVRSCDKGSTLSYNESRTYSVQPVIFYGVSDTTKVQLEIMRNGPVEATMNVYSDFFSYKSGVYQHISEYFTGQHAVRLIGWGEENNVPYWLVTNSWNESWGDKGTFKILRGKDESGIEELVAAGLPRI